MKIRAIIFSFLFVTVLNVGSYAQDFQKDVIQTMGGDLIITFIGHGTLMFEFQGKVIHIDPWSHLADYTKLPKADAILLTHDHGDHLDPDAINTISKEGTELVLTEICYKKLKKGKIIRNNEYIGVVGLPVEAVPAYNTFARRGNGKPYHPKGEGNGYIITFGDTRVYIAGDTEYFPAMEKMQMISIAFLPMNLPFTMAPTMVAICAKAINPQILYPYHFGDTKPEELVKMLMGTKIDVRIRSMK
ncbi:MAG: MBL fold metallo-hydrolase [Bacteroidales bacterium]|nr:MBL fold metallo-hydrolase [Bacteroidales bacterium]